MAKQKRRAYATITVPHWDRVEVPDGAMALAERRTAHLAGVAMRTTLRELLASAYLQGITDTAAILDRPSFREMLAPLP